MSFEKEDWRELIKAWDRWNEYPADPGRCAQVNDSAAAFGDKVGRTSTDVIRFLQEGAREAIGQRHTMGESQ